MVARLARSRRAVNVPKPHRGAPTARDLTAKARTELPFIRRRIDAHQSSPGTFLKTPDRSGAGELMRAKRAELNVIFGEFGPAR